MEKDSNSTMQKCRKRKQSQGTVEGKNKQRNIECETKLADSPDIKTVQAQAQFLQRIKNDSELEKKIESKIQALRNSCISKEESKQKVLFFQSKCLRTAAGCDRLDIVSKLISGTEVDVNEQGNTGATALILACKLGHTDSAKEVLKHPKVKINIEDSAGNTALMYSVQNNLLEVTQLLLAHENIYVNHKNHSENTALIFASSEGFLEIVECLLANKNTDVNIADENDDTALLHAAWDSITK